MYSQVLTTPSTTSDTLSGSSSLHGRATTWIVIGESANLSTSMGVASRANLMRAKGVELLSQLSSNTPSPQVTSTSHYEHVNVWQLFGCKGCAAPRTAWRQVMIDASRSVPRRPQSNSFPPDRDIGLRFSAEAVRHGSTRRHLIDSAPEEFPRSGMVYQYDSSTKSTMPPFISNDLLLSLPLSLFFNFFTSVIIPSLTLFPRARF